MRLGYLLLSRRVCKVSFVLIMAAVERGVCGFMVRIAVCYVRGRVLPHALVCMSFVLRAHPRLRLPTRYIEMELPHEGSPDTSPKAAPQCQLDECYFPSSSDEEHKPRSRASTRTGRSAARKSTGCVSVHVLVCMCRRISLSACL